MFGVAFSPKVHLFKSPMTFANFFQTQENAD